MNKPKPAKKRPRSQLTERQAKYVDAVLTGTAPTTAALALGDTAGALKKSETVRAQLEAARRWLTDITQIKRLDVIEGIIDGIEMARMQGDSGNVIKGWSEVAKILGHYAPEKKVLELSVNQQRLRSKFEAMSDEELLEITRGHVLEGESERVEGEDDGPKTVN